MKKMQAMVINKTGAVGELSLATVDMPQLKPGHVIVQVYASSVNPIDTKIRSGAVDSLLPAFPAILHSDVSGIIVAVADDVSQFKVGDAIFGCAGGIKGMDGGALAEYMLADARLIAHKPNNLDMRQAAALPLVSITAWMALFDKLRIQQDQKILIHGGAGGVGHLAVQLAVAHGAKVYATVSNADDAAMVASLGAIECINYKNESVESYVKRLTDDIGFPLIFDTVGGSNLKKSFAACSLMGKVATIAARVTLDLSRLHQLGADLYCVFMLIPLIHNKNRYVFNEILTQIAGIVEQGKLRPIIDPHQFVLAQAADAHELLESGESHGKVVISIR